MYVEMVHTGNGAFHSSFYGRCTAVVRTMGIVHSIPASGRAVRRPCAHGKWCIPFPLLLKVRINADVAVNNVVHIAQTPLQNILALKDWKVVDILVSENLPFQKGPSIEVGHRVSRQRYQGIPR